MTEVLILSGARTPVGKLLGALKDFSAVELGVIAARAAIERAGIDARLVDEVIMGNVVQAGNGQKPARQGSRGAGVPGRVGARSIYQAFGARVCARMESPRWCEGGGNY